VSNEARSIWANAVWARLSTKIQLSLLPCRLEDGLYFVFVDDVQQQHLNHEVAVAPDAACCSSVSLPWREVNMLTPEQARELLNQHAIKDAENQQLEAITRLDAKLRPAAYCSP